MKSRIFRAAAFIIITLYLFFRWYFFPALPKYNGKITLSGIKDTVEVFTDIYGVPHIFADNEDDLFYAAGYISARERLFQLSTVASASRGELAAFFGETALRDDIYLRTWGIPSTAKKIAASYDQETLAIVKAFCKGINAHIDEAGNSLPAEFKILGKKPLKWTPEDVAGYGRMMAHDLQQSWKSEIMFGLVHQYFGIEKVQELMPAYGEHRPTIVLEQEDHLWSKFANVIWDREKSVRRILGTNGTSIGSNNGVISVRLAQTEGPLLMNDPHLVFSQPAIWYELHLKGGRFNVSGVCLAGLPVPIIGQNEHCAWGFTNVMTDDLDFFVEKTHPDNPNLYQYGNEWVSMEIEEQTIPLPNSRDTTIAIRTTIHGPVISDIHPALRNGKTVISMSWTGHWLTNEMGALIKLGTMKNWDDFSTAVRDFAVPGQNIVYADKEGNIGWRPATRIPVRINGHNLLPRPGADPSYAWQGTVPFEEMPFLLNPEKGYIITANQKTIDDSYKHYISNMWADPSRAQRIEEMVTEKETINIADLKAIQNDVTSPFARELTPFIFNTEKGNETGNIKKAFAMLRHWDGNESPASASAAIFHVILNKLFYNLYYDELAEINHQLMEGLTTLTLFASRNLLWTLEENQSSWFDDIETNDVIESRDDIIYQSVVDAVAEMEAKFGTNPNKWSWGELHTLTHPHALGGIKILNWLFGLNVGPFPSGGSAMTVNNGEYDIIKPYNQKIGASMRRIVDMSDLNATQTVLPTGQSGLSHSPQYDDQAEMFVTGQYRTIPFDENFIRTSKDFQHLFIIPE